MTDVGRAEMHLALRSHASQAAAAAAERTPGPGLRRRHCCVAFGSECWVNRGIKVGPTDERSLLLLFFPPPPPPPPPLLLCLTILLGFPSMGLIEWGESMRDTGLGSAP